MVWSLCTAHLEEGWESGAAAALPPSLADGWRHLLSKVLSLTMSVIAFTVPAALSLPQALLGQLLTADLTARQCRLECAALGPAAVAAAAEAAAVHSTCSVADAATSAAAASCPAVADSAAGFYSSAAGAIRRLVPGSGAVRSAVQLGRNVSAGGLPRGTCLGQCFAAHAWLQVTLGTLLPLALLWAVEDRLRSRALQAWLRRQQREQEQRRASAGPSAGQPTADAAGQKAVSRGRLPRPLGLLPLAAWYAATAWLFWLVLEAVLL
ncbi:hypothetical protein ABPG75_012345 [Micractinium tetrahymenae]